MNKKTLYFWKYINFKTYYMQKREIIILQFKK